MTRLIAFLLALLFAALPASADLKLPALTGRIVDLADVLGAEAEATLTEQLAAHEERTSNQVVVATVPSLQGYDIERFANDLFRAWGLGQKDRNNGVLLLVAPNEREVRIEVGYGLEGTLTDALSADIIQNRILPRLCDGDLAGGITSGTEAILEVLDGPTYRPQNAKWDAYDYQALISAFLSIGSFLFICFCMWRRLKSGRPVRIIMGSGAHSGGGSSGGGSGGGGSSGGGSSGGGGASGHW
jgi:uncharacterized protein